MISNIAYFNLAQLITSIPKITFRLLIHLSMHLAGLAILGAQSANAASIKGSTSENSSTNDVAPSVAFDFAMLKSRGLDPKIAELFSRESRFPGGNRRVGLVVNGSPRGSVEVQFDDDGQLCFNQALMKQANLRVPDDRFKLGSEGNCYDFNSAHPQTEVTLRPSLEEVFIVVSADAICPAKEDIGVFQNGGVGGLLNYEVLGQSSRLSHSSSDFYLSNVELGFNADDWIIRSRQTFSVNSGVSNFQSLYTYAQKTIVTSKQILQFGEINIRNSVFPGTAITGLQVTPEEALLGRSLVGTVVEGIAQSQARVEVRQAGAVIHTSLVPAGPFTLSNVQLLNNFTDLDVRVFETSGQQRNFTVPAASLNQNLMIAPGLSLAAGKVRTFESREMDAPFVVTASDGWNLNRSNLLTVGLLTSSNNYHAAGLTLFSTALPNTSVSFRNTISSTSDEEARGIQGSLSITTPLTEKISANINYTRQTRGFRTLLDTTRKRTPSIVDSARKDEYGAYLTWNDEIFGGWTAGYSVSKGFDSAMSSHLSASWSKPFKHATISLNLERDISEHDGNDSNFRNSRNLYGKDTTIYFNISIPLGNNKSIKGYARKRNGATRFGTTYDNNTNNLAMYSLSAELNSNDKAKDFSGSIKLLPKFAQVNLGYSQSGSYSNTYSGQLRGGIAVHDNGVTFSPYPLTDTFGVAKVGDLAGVKLRTPVGPVWTDAWGNAVIPQINAYRNTRVEVETKSLPRNIDIKNGFQAISAGRGSVNKLEFDVIKSRRALLQVSNSLGEPLNKGAVVLDADGNFITTVVDGGNIFITNVKLDKALNISLGNGKSCKVDFKLSDQPDLNVYFEMAKATCTPD
ncbi:fimbria/pilus outer membrane usher protein [Pseudomonas yamanorum]|uniref:fimbria/pilus outer membrane usher protein n=1 Tax=Pseudomonas yamanorum TaxID=515393 RepID=UPI00087A8934|nr:fimbria/pilus outer membrane usher protein [Pseudomonas yamanorum]SDT99437.1 Outer membrane usher protein FimD/PapC [Pseudomonas yamanorum]